MSNTNLQLSSGVIKRCVGRYHMSLVELLNFILSIMTEEEASVVFKELELDIWVRLLDDCFHFK